MSDCLFCRIVAGEIPADTIAETATALAFRDLAPRAPVHVLVIPKDHHESLSDLADADPQVLADMFALAGQVARSEDVAGSGYRLVSNVGADAGQEIAHVHVHVVGGRRLGAVVAARA